MRGAAASAATTTVPDLATAEERCRTLEGAATAPLDLKPVINTSSYTVRENMSILRAYSLFRTMGCRSMVVVDISNHVVGMLTRPDLVDICHPPHDHGHGHGHGGGGHHDTVAVVPAAEGGGRDAPLLTGSGRS